MVVVLLVVARAASRRGERRDEDEDEARGARDASRQADDDGGGWCAAAECVARKSAGRGAHDAREADHDAATDDVPGRRRCEVEAPGRPSVVSSLCTGWPAAEEKKKTRAVVMRGVPSSGRALAEGRYLKALRV